VERELDGSTTAWAKQREEACRATRIRREQTEDVLALRTACLDRRRDEVAALVSVLRHADRDVVTHAIHATEELAPLDLCSDWRTLSSRLAPPPDAVKDAVAATRRDLARSKALLDAGSFREALALAEGAMARARELGYLPLRAEAGLRLGAAQQAGADEKVAEGTLRGSVVDAEAAGDERTAAEAWGELVVVDAKGGGLERGTADAAHADAIALHLADDELRAEVAEHVGTLLFEQGKFAESEARYAEALAIEERRLGPDHPRVAALLANLTDEKVEEGHMDGVLDAYGRSLAILERAYGPHHPEVARTVHSMGVAAANLGDLPGAEAYFRRTVQVNEDALGPEHPTVARSLIDLASILRELDVKREPEARSLLERALAIQTKTLGPEHADVARTLETLGEVAEDLGDADGARADFVRGLKITEKALGPEHRRVEDMLDDLARLDLDEGHFAEAAELGKRALAIVTKALGEKHPYVADSLTILGRAYVGLHRAGDAIAPLERALALRVAGDAPKEDMAETRFALATALWDRGDAGKDRERARALAVQAQAGLDGAGAAAVRARGAVDEWLRARTKA
jgi:tetratricopeptide (TPR) repeat protein